VKLVVVALPPKTIDSQVSSDTLGNWTKQSVEQEKGVVTLDDELDELKVGGLVVRLGNDDVEVAELRSAFC
jgi:hypothetical protein